ncbi:MAG: hypothetical protein JWP81_1955 [Ferruginibacter sp.]|nr:hypothetical protein [Ferruginibacter sp.]
MKNIKIDEHSQFLLMTVLLSLLLMKNGFYLFVTTATIFLALYILQQPFKPGVFSIFAVQHFLQIAAGVWLCNYLGQDIDYNTNSRSTATIAGCVGIFFLLAPVYYVQNKIPTQTFASLRAFTQQFSTQKIMYAYIVAFFTASSLGAVAFLFGGLTQIIFSLVKIKWMLFLLFGFQCFLRDEKKNIFYIFVALEFLSGFFSFFSEFKTVIYFLIVMIFSLVEKLDFKKVLYVSVVGVCLTVFGLFWTNIKGEYRSFLNSGTSSQVAGVERDAAMDKLYDLSNKVDNEKLEGSVVQMLDRIQYTYHFAKTIDRMPSVLPFEGGDNWLRSLEFSTTPRFLNPDKPTYDATTKTKYYTGIRYLGKEYGVSFSLGYFADCFIDFGIYGMMFVLLALGMVYGLIYNYLLRKSSNNLVFNYAVVGAFFMEFNALEMDSTFLLGRLFSSLVTFILLVQFFFPWLISFISLPPEPEEKKDEKNEEKEEVVLVEAKQN